MMKFKIILIILKLLISKQITNFILDTMSEEPKPQEGGDQRGERGERRGFGRGGRGRGGRGGRGGKGGRPKEEETWTPLTNLGRLVSDGTITKLEEIYYHSIPIKEHQIVDRLIELANKGALKEECVKIKSVQKQTKAGQRTRFKAVVAVGDENGHLGLGTKVAKEVQNAMKGAVIAAKLTLIPIRRGYWGNKIGNPHTVPVKVTGKCGSVRMRLIPAPRGTGIVGAPATKKLLQFAGVQDCFSQSRGNTDTMENFVRAIFDALYKTYCYLTPDLWNIGTIETNIFVEHHAKLNKGEGY
jgi:small subunit ribosomal protein S2e